MKTIVIPDSDNPERHPVPSLLRHSNYWSGHFEAMASPCSILMDDVPEELARALLSAAAVEAWRIEHKFSRYVANNLVDRINRSGGQPVEIDEEGGRLLDYADQCYQLSDGHFDITSGVLRGAWRFDGSNRLPKKADVDSLLPRIGWSKLTWQTPYLTVPDGMELDFGGIGKEYAVDRCLQMLRHHLPQPHEATSLLVNFGGDLACSGPRANGHAWRVGIEDHNLKEHAFQALTVRRGALATSGDSRRYLLKDGVRYSHILDPATGWPVVDAPHSVTVAAPTCTLAGMLATFAMLHGEGAESFLDAQGVKFWVQRE